MPGILFTHSYFLRFDPKQWATGQPYAPLGTIYAAAVLRKSGFPVSLFDTMFAKSPMEIIPVLEREQPDMLVIYDDGFNYLTKMCLSNMRDAAFVMIREAKRRGLAVAICSSDATDHFDAYLGAGADYIVLGEGEQTLLELVTSISQGADSSSVSGIAFSENGNTVKTPARLVMKDLDALPLPAWDLVQIEPYRKMWMQHHGYFSVNISTTRGCPFKCNWCAKPIYGNRYHARSPQIVLEEILLLKSLFSFDHIWFCDDIFGLKPGWVHSFADALEKSSVVIRFRIQSRADLLLQENYVQSLSRAGCENVWMGAESGSQKILDAMDKGITTIQIREATALLRKYRIRPSFFIQFGYPGETKEDIRQTIKMINTLLPYSLGISVSYPLPGTVFYQRVKDDLKGKSNWTDSDEMQIMFRHRYPAAFYKQLHRHVHKSYRLQLAVDQLKKLLHAQAGITVPVIRRIISMAWYAPLTVLSKIKLNRLEKTTSLPEFQ